MKAASPRPEQDVTSPLIMFLNERIWSTLGNAVTLMWSASLTRDFDLLINFCSLAFLAKSSLRSPSSESEDDELSSSLSSSSPSPGSGIGGCFFFSLPGLSPRPPPEPPGDGLLRADPPPGEGGGRLLPPPPPRGRRRRCFSTRVSPTGLNWRSNSGSRSSRPSCLR